MLKVGPRRLLHVEYVRKPTADLYVRMLGYRAHIMRRHRNMRLTQIVIVLGRGRVQYEDDLDNGFMLGLRAVYD